MGTAGSRKRRRTRSDDGRPRSPDHGPCRQEHNVYTVEGQIEQYGNAARAVKIGLRSTRWRRYLVGLFLLPWVMIALVGAVSWLVDQF
jgi:hypothetical protein